MRIQPSGRDYDIITTVLDYFVKKEVIKKMKEEQEDDEIDTLVYRLPFKMKIQSIMENNKAMDERTKEDKERMEKDALIEIETNFPSYYDEFQKGLFSGVFA
jgi:hypothetical protein